MNLALNNAWRQDSMSLPLLPFTYGATWVAKLKAAILFVWFVFARNEKNICTKRNTQTWLQVEPTTNSTRCLNCLDDYKMVFPDGLASHTNSNLMSIQSSIFDVIFTVWTIMWTKAKHRSRKLAPFNMPSTEANHVGITEDSAVKCS